MGKKRATVPQQPRDVLARRLQLSKDECEILQAGALLTRNLPPLQILSSVLPEMRRLGAS
jgi:hypothetical protein